MASSTCPRSLKTGGDDRLDHVHALTEVLSRDERLDTKRAGVVGIPTAAL
ncbi:MAG: hypothetical protein IPL28_09050 [Chloroflexi bacterium]|nr:hypothetical protein [Chloroflexota bacterium]